MPLSIPATDTPTDPAAAILAAFQAARSEIECAPHPDHSPAAEDTALARHIARAVASHAMSCAGFTDTTAARLADALAAAAAELAWSAEA